jgi:hypothetical protein
VLAVIHFDPRTGAAAAVDELTEQPDGRMIAHAVVPQATDRLTMLHMFRPKAGEPIWVEGETLTWNGGLELVFDLVPPGDYVISAEAEAIGGKSETREATVTVMSPDPERMAPLLAARRLTIADLLGQWRDAGSGDPLMTLAPSPFGAGEAVVALAADPATNGSTSVASVVARLDTRRLPMLSIVYAEASGDILGRENFLVIPDLADPDRIALRSFAGGADGRGMTLDLVRVR